MFLPISSRVYALFFQRWRQTPLCFLFVLEIAQIVERADSMLELKRLRVKLVSFIDQYWGIYTGLPVCSGCRLQEEAPVRGVL
jgi:hypothetical protein